MPTLQFDIRELQQLKQQFEPRDVEKALRWAVDATSRKAATHISKDIRDTYAIKAGDIKRRLKIERVRRDATRALLYTGRRLPLAQFKPSTKKVRVTATSSTGKRFKTTRKGVTVRVRKDRGRTLVRGGWYAKGHVLSRAESVMGAGSMKGLFNKDGYARGDEEPIIRFGPSIPGMVAHPETIESAQDLVRRDLPEQFSNRLNYILNQKAGLA